MRRVITVGASTIDCLMKSTSFKVTKSHEIPGGVALCEVLGGKMEAEEGLLTTGGGGTNVAVGLRRLGHSVKVISRVGDDDLANIVISKLREESVNVELLQKGTGKTGLSAVLVSEGGGRSIITYRGESSNILSEQIDWNEVGKADWIQISSLGGNIDLLEDLISFASVKGISVGLNPGKGELDKAERIERLFPKVKYLILNRMEASELTGINFDEQREIFKSISGYGIPLVAITDGKRGASLIGEGKVITMSAFPNKSVDDTGAGDAFVSGSVSSILNDDKLEVILKAGLANGGAAVTVIGAKEGLLYGDGLKRWLNKKLKSIESSI